VEFETPATRSSFADEDCESHEGERLVLVRAGSNVWRYYGLTPGQLRFWRGLTRAERRSLVRAREKQCFICALKALIGAKKRSAEGIYSSMMVSLLAVGERK
jgi:hypothetical protein